MTNFAKRRRLAAALCLSFSAASPMTLAADLQFFGDVYVSDRAVRETGTTTDRPAIFEGVTELLASSTHTIINLEGAITDAFVPKEQKRHLLQMPLLTASILKAAGISAATLANNHSLDFDYAGLFDTTIALDDLGIARAGAGTNLHAASAPLYLSGKHAGVCVIAMSRTLPESFWAAPDQPGVFGADPGEMRQQLRACADSGLFTVATFHWGQEMEGTPLPYQRELAHAAIDSGADLVIGHHPHVVQDVEYYRGHAIFYSLGNFAFATLPTGRPPSGIAVRVALKTNEPPTYEVVPLAVDNHVVRFAPREWPSGSRSPIDEKLSRLRQCRRVENSVRWRCQARKEAARAGD